MHTEELEESRKEREVIMGRFLIITFLPIQTVHVASLDAIITAQTCKLHT